MELKVIWSNFAEIQLDEIFRYYREKASLKIATKLVRDIILQSEYLKKAPFIGQKEIRLQNRKIEYRYLVYKNYKLIYSVHENEGFIKIADVFDTRQYPAKIGRKKISQLPTKPTHNAANGCNVASRLHPAKAALYSRFLLFDYKELMNSRLLLKNV